MLHKYKSGNGRYVKALCGRTMRKSFTTLGLTEVECVQCHQAFKRQFIRDLSNEVGASTRAFAESPPVEVVALYRTFATDYLIDLRAAFVIDLRAEADPTFCQGRIAIIDRILHERPKA